MNKKVLIIVSFIIALVLSTSLIFLLTNNKKLKSYNVSFETNGGTVIVSQSVNEGEKVIKPEDPTKEGYIFMQWLYQGKTYDFSSAVNSNFILTAEWIEKKEEVEVFTVKFNSDEGTTIPNQIIEKGNKVTMPINPIKEGYNFVEWQYNGVKYDFETNVEKNLELTAVYEQIKSTNKQNTDTNTNNTPNIKLDTNKTTSKPNNATTNNTGNNTNVVTNIAIPTLTQEGKGFSPESYGISYIVTDIETIDGIEVYKSTNGSTYNLEKVLTKKQLADTRNVIQIHANIGEYNYYKVRAYKTLKGQKVYSDYSRVMEIEGPRLDVPILTGTGCGGGGETSGESYAVTEIDIADGIEIHKSTNGSNYQLEKTLTIAQLQEKSNEITMIAYIGEHNYYKIKAYKTIKGNKIYSDYSSVIEIKGPKLEVPNLIENGLGGSDETSGKSYEVTELDFADGIEIHKSTDGSNYQLEKTLTIAQLQQQNNTIITIAYKGEHNYYKVRAYKTVKGNKIYSDYSTIVDVKCL